MDTTMQTEMPEGMVDVNDVPLSALWSLEPTPNLERSMRRARAAVEREPQQGVSAFNSAI